MLDALEFGTDATLLSASSRSYLSVASCLSMPDMIRDRMFGPASH
jgi:hypothetical protein